MITKCPTVKRVKKLRLRLALNWIGVELGLQAQYMERQDINECPAARPPLPGEPPLDTVTLKSESELDLHCFEMD